MEKLIVVVIVVIIVIVVVFTAVLKSLKLLIKKSLVLY